MNRMMSQTWRLQVTATEKCRAQKRKTGIKKQTKMTMFSRKLRTSHKGLTTSLIY